MKRKFSLFVTIVVCLLLVVGILSACNEGEKKITSIEFADGEWQTNYYLGEVFKPCVATVTYEDGSTEEVTVTPEMVKGFDTSKLGDYDIEITINGVTKVMTITVVEKGEEAHVHSMELTAAKEATCTEGGNNAYYHCSGCNKYFKDESGTQETTVEAETIPAAGHNWNDGEVTVAATCTEGGVMTYTCLDCDETRTETIAATGHKWNEGEVTTSATCTEDGVRTYTCLNCGETKTETIAATGHNYVNGECTVCGEEEPVYIRIDEDGNESATGDYILFGSYPQTKVTDASIISALGGLDESTWTSYGYFIEGQMSDYMYYIDKEYNGEKYRGVYFTSYRPYYCNYSSGTSYSCQDDNGYATSTVYWFKYEPIKWLIAEESDGTLTLVADPILDSQQYDYEDGSDSNNYAESTIRAWLNDTFCNTAFNEMQQAIIQTTTIDNSVESTGFIPNQYACENTNDKIFLMSYVEADTWFTSDSAREKQGSDYAKSQGVYVNTSSSYSGNSHYRLRSPSSHKSFNAYVVNDDGSIGSSRSVYYTSIGVLPALVIELREPAEHIHTMEKIPAKEATCTEEGNSEYYYCAECGKYFAEGLILDWRISTPKDHIIPVAEHDWDNGEVATAATCTTDGEKIYTCLSCGETKTEIIPAGHNYVNGECTVCGEEEPVYIRIDEDGNESATGDYILFGSYPQTKVTDASIISALGEFDESTWTSYGYFIEGQVSDYMYYIDKEYNGEKYRGVYFTSYRPYLCNDSSSTSDSWQDDNGYATSTVYWFKYEPIKWLIAEESGGTVTLVADLILDSQQYDYEDGSYSNNYAESTIRSWLNETFYNTAFNELQQSIIQTVEVDNSAESTGDNPNQYACENTFDKIFLMSYVEATTWFTRNSAREKLTRNSAREKQGSDYAKSQGLLVDTSSGNSRYWLRSPNHFYSRYARVVNDDGIIGNSNSVDRTNYGVLPALVIEL